MSSNQTVTTTILADMASVAVEAERPDSDETKSMPRLTARSPSDSAPALEPVRGEAAILARFMELVEWGNDQHDELRSLLASLDSDQKSAVFAARMPDKIFEVACRAKLIALTS